MIGTKNDKLEIYWSNVCILKKMEKDKLSNWAKQWQEEKGLDIKVDFFGLGEEMHINEKIATELQHGDLVPNIVISTDVSIFQNKDLLLGQLNQFQILKEHLPLRDELVQKGIAHPSGCFHPCAVALIIMIYNNKLVREIERPESWSATLKPAWRGKILFSGTEMPAGQGFLRGIWYLYGDKGLEQCIKNYQVASSPAAVLQAVSKGEFAAGVVPLVFTGGKGLENVTEIWPQEGALTVPSYVAIRKDAPRAAVDFVKETLFAEEMQQLYTQDALLVPAVPRVSPPGIVVENDFQMVCPKWSWIEQTDMGRLDEVVKQFAPYQ